MAKDMPSRPTPRPAPKLQLLRPGMPTPTFGPYKTTKTGTEVTSTQGNPLPPSPKGSQFILVDASQHQNG